MPHQPEFQDFHLDFMKRANHNAESSNIASIESASQQVFTFGMEFMVIGFSIQQLWRQMASNTSRDGCFEYNYQLANQSFGFIPHYFCDGYGYVYDALKANLMVFGPPAQQRDLYDQAVVHLFTASPFLIYFIASPFADSHGTTYVNSLLRLVLSPSAQLQMCLLPQVVGANEFAPAPAPEKSDSAGLAISVGSLVVGKN
ncbi:hypothetical protein RHMOL_Rhmol11G0199300 [Rhododendron molle]|uniref:Uncharacterized protein n=2 Tax=Rhododendron molle TaxID=49168 RepID=A0ACC0LUG0_RHOML|nr:hypothetical protein RHMOL_Rhmol11G0199300 [Rhododendron molle]KAI8532259.1 hypothetical protein RHMOL_Rhmol11G0199300 [Rhododendron molle]